MTASKADRLRKLLRSVQKEADMVAAIIDLALILEEVIDDLEE